MRKCPHCAETILTDAKICRFCQRDVNPSTPRKRGSKVVLAVVSLVLLVIVVGYFSRDSAEFDAWKAKRDAWHAKCDAYLKTPLSDPNAAACNEELQQLSAEAKQHGWID